MGWKRRSALLFAGLLVMACGTTTAPTSRTSPPSSPTPTPIAQSGVGSVSCTGAPGGALAAIADRFVYDVSDPVQPRLLCRSTKTFIHVVDGNTIAYTTVVDGQTFVVRHNLTTGSESRVGSLPADPQSSPFGVSTAWTSDGLLEAFATSSVPDANGTFQMQLHLWSQSADHVIGTIDRVPMGFESRWSPFGVAAFSPDHAYLAFSPVLDLMRIYSVADQRQVLAAATRGVGGTWIANDHFVWAAAQGVSTPSGVMQWTPAAGATVFRPDYWYSPTSSQNGAWLAATEPYRSNAQSDTSYPRVIFVSASGIKVFESHLGSGPGFVTATVAWFAEEKPCATQCASPTAPDGTVHAFDVTTGADQTVRFRAGEEPVADGTNFCCFTGAR